MAGDDLVLDRVSKRFPPPARGEKAHVALSDVSLAVSAGEFLVVVGPSGCGKSTMLRLVAGLEELDSGEILIAGKSMHGVAPQDRDIAMVFQGYALYPKMTVLENLEFPLKMRGVSSAERRKTSVRVAKILKIEELLARRPPELSGGQRQRVAMGRAIVREPRIFLFDEPLSNLDAALRAELRVELGSLVRRLGKAAVYVTHDQVEAMTLADRICILHAGRIIQIASPREVYERPATSFVGKFIGSPAMNVLRARVDGGFARAGPMFVPFRRSDLPREVDLGIRPEDLSMDKSSDADRVWEVVTVEPLGSETHVVVRSGEIDVRVTVSGFGAWERGERISLRPDAAHVHWFDPAREGARIDVEA